VASFHARVSHLLAKNGLDLPMPVSPNEVTEAIPFAQDETHRTYDPEAAHRFWRALTRADQVMKLFRSYFVGKSSPVHFFWGSFDLAVTRFSGRRAPPHPGGFPNLPDEVAREAYSHEVSSCGFWPGNDMYPQAAFYSYAYPMPPGFEKARVAPAEASFHPQLREFLLPYDVVRSSRSPSDRVLDFFQSTYEAAAQLGDWDRDALERSPWLEIVRKAA
jgi:hypothetical protein